MQIQNLVVCKNKEKSHGKSCPGPGTLLNQHSEPPPHLSLSCVFFVSVFCFVLFYFVFLLFQNFVADRNK